MTDAIQSAALAFERDMSGKAAPSPAGARERVGAPESIFGNSDASENDIVAGGDALPAPVEKRARPEPEDEDEFSLADEEVEEQGEDDETVEEDKDDDDDDDELLNRKFTVMVDGAEEEITLREALDGGIRTKTFYKRMNQLDSARKDLQAHAQVIVEDRQRYDTMLSEAEEILSGILPQEPDWDKLFAEDPKAARELQKQYDNYKGKITEIREKRLKAQRDQAERSVKEMEEYTKSEFPKFSAYAKWRDKEEMQKDINSMRKSALTAGFTEAEVAQVLDHRMLIVLLKASKYDRMMAAKPKPVSSTKTPVSPGAGSKGTAQRGIVGAQKKLARSGSIDDAANVFAKIIR